MTTSRLALLLAVLLGGLSTVLLLPKQIQFQPVGIELTLPEYVGEWLGENMKVSDLERQVLGPETEFSRKNYSNGRGDQLQVSIVLGGQDMNTSIHRPERCLPAQGWTISDKRAVKIALPALGTVPTTRLSNVRSMSLASEPPRTVHGVNYYWFVGHTSITNSHLERTWIDIRDRLLHGYNQRWAYLTVATTVTKDLKKFGRDEKETDQLIQAFIKQLAPLVQKESVRES